MIVLLLLLLPLISAAAVFALKREVFSRFMLIFTGLLHLGLVCAVPFAGVPLALGKTVSLEFTGAGFYVLCVTSLLFLFTSVHLNFWLPRDREASGGHAGMSVASFASFLLLFLFTMTLTAAAQGFGMLWVAVEATTLASAPLINFHRGKTALEAMWKYLLICSIGIGLALFGTMLLAASVNVPLNSLSFAGLKAVFAENKFDMIWFKTGFVFCFAGYALKMGLAPFHTWLPDAHSEAPAPVSALLSGSLLNCALLAVIRLWDVTPDGLQVFCGNYLKFFGFFSLATAAFFIINQKDFKRMLAYSSVEHMGLIVLLVVYCGENWWVFHMLAHSLTKMALFLVAGNILLAYGTRSIAAVRGMGEKLPFNSALWITGMLMICGTPPSPLFLTELQLVKSAGLIPGIAILLLLLIIFCGMSRCMIGMSSGKPSVGGIDRKNDRLGLTSALAMTVIVLLGIRFTAMLLWRV